MEFKGVWSLRRKKWEGVEIWRNRRAARRKTNRKTEGWRAEESARFTARPLRLLCEKNNAVHIKKSKRTKSNRAARPGQKQKAIVWRGRIGEKKTEKKKQHEHQHQHQRGQVTSCSLQQQEGQKVFFIQQRVRRRLISAAYCQVEIRPTCKHI